MPKTRSRGGASAMPESSSASTSSKSKYTLAPEDPNPPKIFILPKQTTPEARVVSLLNPRCNRPTRYLVCPESGIYEFTRIAAPKSTPRSCLIELQSGKDEAEGETEESEESFDAYVTKGAELYIATPFDPLFLMLPTLFPQSNSVSSSKSEKKLFLASDDYFDTISKEESPHFSEVLRWGNVRALLESRMAVACDTVEAGDEIMYRPSEAKLLTGLLSKARCVSESGLPPSMEEKFVTKVLEAPVLSLKRDMNSLSGTTAGAGAASESGASTPRLDAAESQASTSTTDTGASFASEASTAATSVAAGDDDAIISAALTPSISASAEVVQLQRLRTAFNFICSSCVAPHLATRLKDQLSAADIDFKPLGEYISAVTKLRQEAAASRNMGDYSRKRVLDEDEAMERAEKKRRREEEEKRKKAGESMGVRSLKKVNIAGMKKMSDFFKKK